MLLCEDFGGRHDCRLITVLYGNDHSFESDDGLSASDIALHQPVHGMRRLQVLDDFFEHALLRRCWMKWKNALHPVANAIVRFEPRAGQHTRMTSTKREYQFQEEEL